MKIAQHLKSRSIFLDSTDLLALGSSPERPWVRVLSLDPPTLKSEDSPKSRSPGPGLRKILFNHNGTGYIQFPNPKVKPGRKDPKSVSLDPTDLEAIRMCLDEINRALTNDSDLKVELTSRGHLRLLIRAWKFV